MLCAVFSNTLIHSLKFRLRQLFRQELLCRFAAYLFNRDKLSFSTVIFVLNSVYALIKLLMSCCEYGFHVFPPSRVFSAFCLGGFKDGKDTSEIRGSEWKIQNHLSRVELNQGLP